jgi:hypothetical protein
MCYTAKTSIKAFITGSLFSILLICFSKNKDYIILGGFFLFISLMQLYDFIFWNNKPPSSINHITTQIACITNHLQPIILGLIIYFAKGKIETKSLATLIIYTVCITVYTLQYWNKLTYTKVNSKSSPSLYWEWNHFGKESPMIYILFLSTITVLLLYNLNSPINYIISIISILLFLFSYVKYRFIISYGRFWCYLGTFIPILLLFISNSRSLLNFVSKS